MRTSTLLTALAFTAFGTSNALAQGCQETLVTAPITGGVMRTLLRLHDGKPIAQTGRLEIGGGDSPFLLNIWFPEPDTATPWVHGYFYATKTGPVTLADSLRIIAPDGQHWDRRAYVLNLKSKTGRPGIAASFPLVTDEEPNRPLGRILAAGGTFRLQRRRGEVVVAEGSLQVPTSAERIALHQKTLAEARGKLNSCPPNLIPPETAP